jgi:hypothetical protein
MAIPESQLDTWSRQGSITQSSGTYQSIRAALLKDSAAYATKRPEVFLQGSYGNDTNIYAESDVDCVILYNGAFYYDLDALPADQQALFKAGAGGAAYSYNTFKAEVLAALTSSFGASVDPNSRRAIKIKAGGGRRSADVIVAFQFRRYYMYKGDNDQRFDTGMAFFTSDGKRVANFPKIHSANLTIKHQATGSNFKPMARIFKNIRSRLVDNGQIKDGVAPSYFIEGLLYNAPNSLFQGKYADMVLNILKWLHATPDRSKFVCANEKYYLLRDDSLVCWPTADGAKFITETIKLWNDW